MSEWGEYLERELVLRRPDADVSGRDILPGDPGLPEAEYVNAVCSGFLEREALAFAKDMALADLTPGEAAADHRTMVERAFAAAATAARRTPPLSR